MLRFVNEYWPVHFNKPIRQNVVDKSLNKYVLVVYHYLLEFINRDGSGPFYLVQSTIYTVRSAAGGNLLLSFLRHLWFCNLDVCNMKYRCRGKKRRTGRFLPHTRQLKSLSVLRRSGRNAHSEM